MGGKHSTSSTSNGGSQSVRGRSAGASPPRGSVTPRGSTRPRHEFLDDDEPDIIRRHWKTIKSGDTQSMGIRIFLRIFELEPKTQDAFSSLRGMAPDELITNVLFRSHSMRFMQAVEGTVVNLEALDVIIVPNLRQLGKRHTHFSGFHPQYLIAFEQAMDETWRAELGPKEYDSKAQKAWQKIFKLITTTVLSGYTEPPFKPVAKPAAPEASVSTTTTTTTTTTKTTTNDTDTATTTTSNSIKTSEIMEASGMTSAQIKDSNNIVLNNSASKTFESNNESRDYQHVYQSNGVKDGAVLCPSNGVDKNSKQLVT